MIVRIFSGYKLNKSTYCQVHARKKKDPKTPN